MDFGPTSGIRGGIMFINCGEGHYVRDTAIERVDVYEITGTYYVYLKVNGDAMNHFASFKTKKEALNAARNLINDIGR